MGFSGLSNPSVCLFLLLLIHSDLSISVTLFKDLWRWSVKLFVGSVPEENMANTSSAGSSADVVNSDTVHLSIPDDFHSDASGSPQLSPSLWDEIRSSLLCSSYGSFSSDDDEDGNHNPDELENPIFYQGDEGKLEPNHDIEGNPKDGSCFKDGSCSAKETNSNQDMLTNPHRETQCAICLSDFIRGDPIYILPRCDHIFHQNCMAKWLDQQQSTCPLCRSSLVSEDLSMRYQRREHELVDELIQWFSSLHGS